MNTRRRLQSGFTAVEIMVALTLGLIVLGGVTTVLVNSKKNYVVQDSLARLQENARFAVDFIAKDLREAGYYGCHDDVTSVQSQLNSTNGSNDLFAYLLGNPIEGLEALANPANEQWEPSGNSDSIPDNRIAGTDAFMVRASSREKVFVEMEMPNESAALQVTKNDWLKEGDVVVVSDCSSADLFQITNYNDDPANQDELVHNPGSDEIPGNDTSNNPHKLSKRYGTDAQILKFRAHLYFIGTGASGNPALFRQELNNNGDGTLSAVPYELVDGVENMQVLYGVDKTEDRDPNVFVPASNVSAAGGWDNVVAARITLLAYSISSETTTGEFGTGVDTKSWNLDPTATSYTGQSVSGGRKRRLFRYTVALRNLR
jgi:type IV pilus assembly protein PilW